MALLHSATGWWIDEAGAPEPRPPFAGFDEADVVVVGGGYLGMWTAWHLLERDPGTNVMLSRPAAAGMGRADATAASSTATGVTRPDSREPLRRRARGAPRAGGRRARSARSASSAGARSSTPGIAPVPQIDISTAPRRTTPGARSVTDCARSGHGEEYVELTRAQVQEICRSPVFRGAAPSRTAATVQPARLAFGLRAALLRRGVRSTRTPRSSASIRAARACACAPARPRGAATSTRAPWCSPRVGARCAGRASRAS